MALNFRRTKKRAYGFTAVKRAQIGVSRLVGLQTSLHQRPVARNALENKGLVTAEQLCRYIVWVYTLNFFYCRWDVEHGQFFLLVTTGE